MIQFFKNDDDGYIRWLRSNPTGYVYNDFGGMSPDYKKLHRSDCTKLHNVRPGSKKTSVRKICSSNLPEMVAWLVKNRGPEGKGYSFCITCYPTPRDPESAPFREAEVKQILVKYLQGKGYQVRTEVLVSSGMVDIVGASPDGSQIMIEVKGEDAGGYTSAEMNFQMGVGQIISRMTDPGSDYALAIPMTGDFKRVLKKYKGSIGFERLGLLFFVVHRDGKVDEYDARAMAAFIHKL